MSCLVLVVPAGGTLLLEGVRVRFASKTRIELLDRARFLLGHKVMPVEEATTPARRLYFELQQAYAGPFELRDDAYARAVQAAMLGGLDHQAAGKALATAQAGEFYPALKLVWEIICREEAGAAGDQGPRADGRIEATPCST